MYVLNKSKYLTVYKGTITGLRISADNTAFIDNAGATIPTYADGNHSIEIYDTSGRMLKGILKAAGTGEALDSELITNGDFEIDDIGESGWNPYTGTDTVALSSDIKHGGTYSLHIAEANNTFPAGVRRSVTGKTQYGLYKSVFWYNVVSPEAGAGGLRGIVYDNAWSSQIITSDKYTATSGSWVQSTTYGTETASGSNGGTSFVNDSDSIAGEFYVDDHSLKKVLTPSTSGATIVSAKGGTTYNFAYKHASFTFNAASYYCIVRKIR